MPDATCSSRTALRLPQIEVRPKSPNARIANTTNPVVVNDLGNDGELASGRAVVDENDTADLDETLEHGGLLGLDISFALWGI